MDSKLVPQGHWGWKIAAYLFLAGAGSGAYVTGSVADYLGREYATLSRIGIMLSAPLVFVGMLFLILDLGLKRNALHAFAHVRSSWISRGTWIISIFLVLSTLEIVTRFWPFEWLSTQRSFDLSLEMIASGLAIATMVYSGLVLGASKPIAFWSTPLLPLLFFVSASSCGVMLVLLGGVVYGIRHCFSRSFHSSRCGTGTRRLVSCSTVLAGHPPRRGVSILCPDVREGEIGEKILGRCGRCWPSHSFDSRSISGFIAHWE